MDCVVFTVLRKVVEVRIAPIGFRWGAIYELGEWIVMNHTIGGRCVHELTLDIDPRIIHHLEELIDVEALIEF